MHRRRRNAQGFTLVEISIVVAVVGTVSALSLPAVRRVHISGNETAAQASLSTFRSAMEMYRAVNGQFPADLNELANATPPYLDASLADGTRRGYTYVLSNAGTSTYTITAVPESPNVTGVRRFQLTEGGDIVDADATVSAQDVSAANVTKQGGRWFTDGKEKWTFWGRTWLEYEVDFGSGGIFDVGLTARNEGALPPPAKYKFAVDVYVDGVYQGELKLDADNKRYDTKQTALSISSGKHTVRYVWGNDKYKKGVYDANIRVKHVSFKKKH